MKSVFTLTLLAFVVSCAFAGHNEMFGCRSKTCPVTELTDKNFDLKLAEPHFVMFYAPWCGHCKSLAPKLKQAAKELSDLGLRVGAVDVEPNPTVQGKFPDIRGFPTLKFLPSTKTSKAVDYNGARETDAIVQFVKQQAEAAGFAMNEPVPLKTNDELFTFFGRSALDRKPALLLLGTDAQAPSWLGKVASDLRKRPPSADSAEKETRELLKKAAKVTKIANVREGVDSLLAVIDSAEKQSTQGPPVVTPAYTNDMDAVSAFGLTKSSLPALVFASVDRKTGLGNYVTYSGNLKKPVAASVVDFAQDLLPHMTEPSTLMEHSSDAKSLPAFPKPANVIAAEKRAAAKSGEVHDITDSDSLNEWCYNLDGRTCALFISASSADATAHNDRFSSISRKYSRDGFTFSSIMSTSAPLSLIQSLLGESVELPALVVLKTGKRPRAVHSTNLDSFESLLDDVIAGGAQFKKISGGLPQWE